MEQFDEFVKRLQLSHISDQEITAYKSAIQSFLEACSYRLTDDRIIIYINRLKEEFEPKTVRNKLIKIRRFLKFINHPLADDVKLPKIPKRRKNVIKVGHIRNLLNKAEELREPYRSRLKCAVLLSATSGLRAEELYKLRLNDIDVEDRVIRVRAEIAKDFEDRVTFFSEEAKEALIYYLEITGGRDYLFSKKSLNYHLAKLSDSLRMKHMRKFFSQQSDRLGMPTAVKKILMGHSLRGDVDLSHYDFQDEEELKEVYDRYWASYRFF
ncbi:MAG: tyrosine-type recombinase/integrase [Archaeoglobus sp.]|uniref:tyrosine-type recombinase/integrase n=1 Tax=Archaeoglobus sp. TaxID=1872626 RepID=UPI001D9291F6|nr:tyrosine-type recombinase/integrase [Archaeoglobus sp.]MBO8180664.1 tyrosine-type recombinase/integrase [Archaeoglobus sp.]